MNPSWEPNSFVNLEPPTLIGLTCLTTNGRALLAPKLNHRRAVFVLSKIDAILAWERATDRERDSKFVELGRYLCEVRAGQYWRVDNVRSFDEFLERKFPESLGSDKSRGYCLEMICADFLAGVSLETGNQDALLPSLTRLVPSLPKPQIRQLLENVQVTL